MFLKYIACREMTDPWKSTLASHRCYRKLQGHWRLFSVQTAPLVFCSQRCLSALLGCWDMLIRYQNGNNVVSWSNFCFILALSATLTFFQEESIRQFLGSLDMDVKNQGPNSTHILPENNVEKGKQENPSPEADSSLLVSYFLLTRETQTYMEDLVIRT